MATVTDLTGNQNSASDSTSVQIYADSNINVFEFGNLILADILPSISWVTIYVKDLIGNSSSISDTSGSSSSIADNSGSSSSIIDMGGS